VFHHINHIHVDFIYKYIYTHTHSLYFFPFRLEMKVTKSSGGMPRLSYTGRDDRHFLPSGLYIIKTVNGKREGWRNRIILMECFVKDEFVIIFFSLSFSL